MTARLHPNTIEAVKNRSNIQEVVLEFCSGAKDKNRGLLPDGRLVLIFPSEGVYAIIPQHHAEEADPFFYREEVGNSIKFMMTVGGENFTDAVIHLAQRYQIPVETYELDHELAAR
jgi:DNA primase